MKIAAKNPKAAFRSGARRVRLGRWLRRFGDRELGACAGGAQVEIPDLRPGCRRAHWQLARPPLSSVARSLPSVARALFRRRRSARRSAVKERGGDCVRDSGGPSRGLLSRGDVDDVRGRVDRGADAFVEGRDGLAPHPSRRPAQCLPVVINASIVARRRSIVSTSRFWSGSETPATTTFEVARYVFGSISETTNTAAVSGTTISTISSLLRRSASSSGRSRRAGQGKRRRRVRPAGHSPEEPSLCR